MKSSHVFIAFWALFVALHVAAWYTYKQGFYLWFGATMFGAGAAWFIAGMAVYAFLQAHWSWKK